MKKTSKEKVVAIYNSDKTRHLIALTNNVNISIDLQSYVNQISEEERLRVSKLSADEKKEYAVNYYKSILHPFFDEICEKGIAVDIFTTFEFDDNSHILLKQIISDESRIAIQSRKCNLSPIEQEQIVETAIMNALVISKSVLSICNIPCDFDYYFGILKDKL